MKILYVAAPEDKDYLPTLNKLAAIRGNQITVTMGRADTAAEVGLLAKRNNCEAVMTSAHWLLQSALGALPDYRKPDSRKDLTLNDFAGSLINLPTGQELLILNPLQRLHTIRHEKYIVNRYISKLTQPDSWFKQMPFKWQKVSIENHEQFIHDVNRAKLIAIDIETLKEDRFIEMVCYCCWFPEENKCISWVIYLNSWFEFDLMRKANASEPAKIFQRGIYDNAYFLRWGAPVHNWLWDSLILMHCWYSELPKTLAFIGTFSLRKVRFWKDDGTNGSLEDKMRYNAMDGWATLNGLISMIAEMPQWARDNYYQEFPLVFPSIHAAMEGIKVDQARFEVVRQQKKEQAAEQLERVRYLLSEETFNPRSPVQMVNLLKILGCGYLKSSNKPSILKARAVSPLNDFILGEIVIYKKAAKLVSTYLVEEKFWNWRCFYELDPAGTDTGRAASSESQFWCGLQIQNIPAGDSIKQFLVADTGWELAEADKAQSEARCVGYMSGESKLIELVESPKDYHSWNAQAFFGIPYETIYNEATGKTINKEVRDFSKRTNHGANYNMGDQVMLDTMGPKLVIKAKALLKLPLGWSLKKCCGYLLECYEKTYPRVKGLFYDNIIMEVEVTNKLVSAFGWTRYFFKKPSRRDKPALNAAVAHGPQNLSVSIINREWYSIWRETVYGKFIGTVRIKAQIHDSIFFQYPKGKREVAEQVCSMMNTKVKVIGADGITRTMMIPSDLKCGSTRWSELE